MGGSCKKFIVGFVIIVMAMASGEEPSDLKALAKSLLAKVHHLSYDLEQVKEKSLAMAAKVDLLERKLETAETNVKAMDERLVHLEQLSKMLSPKSCDELADHGVNLSGYYTIDSDGPMQGLPSSPIYCTFDQTDAQDNLIVTTGNNGEGRNSYDQTEVFSLSEVVGKKCKNLASYPVKVSGASGALISSKLVICGGSSGNQTPSDQCFSFDPLQQKWQKAGNLQKPRVVSSSIEINGQLFMTGGYNLNSTEFFDIASKKSRSGPDLPHKMNFHCIVKLNSTTALIIGGVNGADVYKKTYYFSIPDGNFGEGPDLLQGRCHHSCGILHTQEGSYVVVAGGFNHNEDTLDTTEYLSLHDQPSWKQGPRLPEAIRSASMATGTNHVLVVGGMNNSHSILRLKCVSQGCAWEKLPIELSHPRNFHVSFLVPGNSSFCTP